MKFSDDKSDEENKVAVASNAHDANFVRHDTPHPRELKARHQKLFNEKQQEYNDKNDAPSHHETRPRSDTISSNNSESDASSVIVRSESEAATHQREMELEQPRYQRDVHTNVEEADNLDYHGQSHMNGNAPEHEAVTSDESETDTTAIFNERHVGFNEVSDEPATEEENDPERVERHNKLHRRDTPHHLKNKRINLANPKDEEDKVINNN